MSIVDDPAATPRATTVAMTAVRAARRAPRRRTSLVLGLLGLTLVGALLARALLGDYTIAAADAIRMLTGGAVDDAPAARFIFLESKLPRAVLGALVGLAFGLSGAIFQTVLRNPLASPDLIGVGMGASAAATFAIVVTGADESSLALWALGGAIGTALAIRAVAGRGPGPHLVLVGVTATFALQSVIFYLFTRASIFDASLALRWLTGSLGAADWATIRVLALSLLVLLPLTVWLAKPVPLMELGEDVARGLGVRHAQDDLLLIVGVILTAVAVAASGPIAFVSFLAGPIARGLNAGRTSLTGAALAGAVIVVASDYLGEYLLADVNFPVGVVTGALGAPFLLWLLVSGRSGRTTA